MGVALQRTIFGKERAFPLKDAYGPVAKARIPVPGLNRFPGRQVLGRHYYGVDQDETPANASDSTPGRVTAFNAEPVAIVNADGDEVAGFAGFGDASDGWPTFPGNTGGSTTGGGGSSGGGGGIDWGAIINTGIHSMPAIIQAAEGGGAPWNFYQQGIGAYQNPQAGVSGQIQYINGVPYTRNSSGQLVSLQSAGQLGGGLGVGLAQVGNSLSSFVQQNSLVVLGAGVLLLFLFMKPPGRR